MHEAEEHEARAKRHGRAGVDEERGEDHRGESVPGVEAERGVCDEEAARVEMQAEGREGVVAQAGEAPQHEVGGEDDQPAEIVARHARQKKDSDSRAAACGVPLQTLSTARRKRRPYALQAR